MSNFKCERSSLLTIIKKETGVAKKKRQLDQTDIAHVKFAQTKRIIKMTALNDLVNILENTTDAISFTGTSHTMGGHTLCVNGTRIDTKNFNKILSINLKSKEVTVEPGLTWSDLIVYLNNFGMSPKTIQSYSGFSIGGSIFGPNAHGILSDYNIGHSVISFRLMLANNELYEVKAGEPLFNYMIGSYGVFGFVYEITLKIVSNSKLKRVSKVLPIETGFEEFSKDIFDGTYHDDNSNDSTQIKFMRLNSSLNEMTYFKYVHTGNIASQLDRNPPSLSYLALVLFHWCAHWTMFKKLKEFIESFSNVHLDAVYSSDSIVLVDRNVFAYESPECISGKLSHLNATHILQEYFIPYMDDLPYKFITLLKQKYIALSEIELLNVTVRIVKCDEHKFLMSYSPNSHMFAFVLYIRMSLTSSAEAKLKSIQIELNEFAIKARGTFYLPYLHHYTRDQLLNAYPNILEYIAFKHQIDPLNRFQNMWFQNIENLLCDDIKKYKLKTSLDSVLGESTKIVHNVVDKEYVYNVEQKNTHIICDMVSDQNLKIKFKMFLQFIFTLHKHGEIMNVLEQFASTQIDDKQIYLNYLSQFYSRAFFVSNILKLPSFISRARSTLDFQLHEIKSEIQLITDFVRYNRINVKSILNVGDKGLYHDLYSKLFPNASRNYVTIDWNNKSNMWIKGMQDEVIDTNVTQPKHDIVFALAGLHHYSLDDLDRVLSHCANTINDHGLFILRDHDVKCENDNILVRNAHTVFNALVGEKHHVELNELVHFRSKEGWEHLLGKYGFSKIIKVYDENTSQDVEISELQKHDMTRNFMMCFQYHSSNVNIPNSDDVKSTFISLGGNVKPAVKSFEQIPEWYNVEYSKEYANFLIDYPWFQFPFLRALFQMIATCKFAYDVDRKDKVTFSSDIVMSLFVILCHCASCVFLAMFGSIIKLFVTNEEIGGTRDILVSNPNKYNLEQPILFNNKEYMARVKKISDETNEYLVQIPMYRPFTEIVKKWFDEDDKLQITSISGNSKVWVDVRGCTIKSAKWSIHTKNSLNDKNVKLNTIKLNVTDLRELYAISKHGDSTLLHIFQQ